MRLTPRTAAAILLLFILLPFLAACNGTATRAQETATSDKGTATRDKQTATSDQGTVIVIPQSTISIPQSTITPTPLSPVPFTPTPLSPLPSTPSLQSTSYNLAAHFDFYTRSLSVEETITYTNATTQPLADLMLVVPANRWPGAFQLQSIRFADGQPEADYTLQLHKLSLALPQPLPPSAQVSFTLVYDLALPPIPDPSEAAPQPFGYTPSQINLVDWYAYVAPYRDGWLVHDPGFWGEYQVFDEGNFHVDLTMANNAPGLVVAASAAPYDTLRGNETTYQYQLDSARTFAISISPSYHVISQTVDLGSSAVVVYSYAYAFDMEAGRAALEDTARALQLYSELFGPYLHATLSVVEADFLDGMEYDGLYFLSKGFFNLYKGTPDSYLTAIAVHETAHQWWYGLVGNDQALEPWLDEALCAFTERLYYERYYPQALAGWWQPYRVDYYEPRGLVGGSIYAYAGYRAYRDGVYLHGQEFLQAVRQRTGDTAFFAFLKDYAARYRGKIATGQDFFNLLAEHSSVNIDDLLSEYFGK